MTVSNHTSFSVSETMGAEVEDKVIVVWKYPESQIDQIAEFIHCFNVGVFSEIRTHVKIYNFLQESFVSINSKKSQLIFKRNITLHYQKYLMVFYIMLRIVLLFV